MFTNFIAILSLPRDKIMVIKLLRQIAGPDHRLGNSLKNAKFAVEDAIDFDPDHSDEFVSIKLRLDEAGVGRLAYYVMKHPVAGIVDIVGIDADLCDFDIT
jgi:hypothetical protein